MSAAAPLKPMPTVHDIMVAAAGACEVTVAAMLYGGRHRNLCSARAVATVLLMDLRCMTGLAVARLLGLHHTTVYHHTTHNRTVYGQRIEAARRALGVSSSTRSIPSSSQIIWAATMACGVTESELFGKTSGGKCSRNPEIVRARRVAFALLRDVSHLTITDIGRRFRITHSCVSHGIYAARRNYADYINTARRMLRLAPEVTA